MITDFEYYTALLVRRPPSPKNFTRRHVRLVANALHRCRLSMSDEVIERVLTDILKRDPAFYDRVMALYEEDERGKR